MRRSPWLSLLLASSLAVPQAPPTERITATQSVTPVQSESVEVGLVHSPPVDAPIVDPFRAPEHEFGPGNRGLEYATSAGQPVRASATGIVSFAGQVGGNRFVTIDHGEGLVTTVGFVAEVLVAEGEVVERGSVIATAGPTTHFSARRNGAYFDPELLFVELRVAVRLVAGE